MAEKKGDYQLYEKEEDDIVEVYNSEGRDKSWIIGIKKDGSLHLIKHTTSGVEKLDPEIPDEVRSVLKNSNIYKKITS